MTRVCSTAYFYHYLLQETPDTIQQIQENGLRPLSDFDDSPRWQNSAEFYKMLYEMMGKPFLKIPFPNSGIFGTTIDFYQIEGQSLSQKPRFAVRLGDLDPAKSIITHMWQDERIAELLNQQLVETIADIWLADAVNKWFGVDPTKIFFYVPQIATYQGNIPPECLILQQPE